MDQDDQKISILLGMGFPDVQAIKRALRMSNGDMNDAVTYLTENPLPSYNTVEDLRDVDMQDANTGGSLSTNNEQSSESSNLEFPTTHLYDLESRLFIESWVIPYKREESLGLCLVAATKLAEEGLCEADEICKRFLDRCLPECFQKLLNSLAVRRWGSDIQEGIFNMVDLLIDFVIARLKNGSIPEDLLRNSFSLVFDPESEWNQKNKHRNSEYFGDTVYAECTSTFESYGWLIDILNIFGNKGGFELLSQKLQEREDLDAGQLTGLFLPVAYSAKFMSRDIVSNLFYSSINKAVLYIKNLEEKDLKGKRIKYCYQLLQSIYTVCEYFWPEERERITSLHLQTIIRMLKTPHFSARMVALKELGNIIHSSEKQNCHGMDADFIQDWMTDKAVLSLALEGNLDQVQYTDRMKQLVEFLGPKLKEEELSKIWNLCEKASPHVVDNVHQIMVAAATRFNPHQFEHLLKLIRKSWENSNDRLREKLLSLIGKIGQDSRLGRTAEKMLDVLWELARVPSLPPHLVHLAIEEHLRILNESATREQLRKFFITRCVEDIRRSPAVYLPLKQLHHLSQSIIRGSTSYSKSEKATLSDLNRSLEIVKLISQSLSKSHALAVQACQNEVPSADTLIDGKYTHSDYIFAHLDFLQFLLKEGDIYLAWPRCKEIWDTLVVNPKASPRDKETCFSWFSQCLPDLEATTQRDLFHERLLELDRASLSPSAFTCFVDYFHAINLSERKILKSATNKMVVESLEPLGLDFIWEIVLECSDQQLADEAIRLLLDMSYLSLSPKLKKDPPQIHQKFISECYKKLEKSLLHVNQSLIGTTVTNATKTLTAVAVSEIASLSPSSKRACLQHIYRILILVERYVSIVEELFCAPRILLPHAACFLGKPVTITISYDGTNNQTDLQCHTNEHLGSVYSKIAKGASVGVDQIQQVAFDGSEPVDLHQSDGKQAILMNGPERENQLLHQLYHCSSIRANVKINSSSGAQLKEVGNTWNELPHTFCLGDSARNSGASGDNCDKSGPSGNPEGGATTSQEPSPVGSTPTPVDDSSSCLAGDSNLKEEKKLPGVVMASLGKNVFSMLYQLALLDDHRIVEAVQRILYLIPTDPLVADKMDSICSGSVGVASTLSKTSPVNSPAKKEKTSDRSKKKENNFKVLRSLLEVSSPEITPFRLLYNLEVLSSKVMPLAGEVTMQSSSQFCEEFLSCGGLTVLASLLHREALPQEMDYEIRQNICLIVLQMLSYLLCGRDDSTKDTPVVSLQCPLPPKRSALDALAFKKEIGDGKTGKNLSPSPLFIASKSLQNLNCDEWLELVSCVMRVAWASAAGKLFLCSSGVSFFDHNLNSPESFKSSRENSTGSAHSSGSDSDRSFQGGICIQQSTLNPTDALIAIQGLPLLITALRLRPNFIEKWYGISSVKDFIIEMLIGCSSPEVREEACRQFARFTSIPTSTCPQPSHFLTQILHKARLPLWVSSTSARGATLRCIAQCSQYFSLNSRLLCNLSQNSQETLGVDAMQMAEDEINWLSNFTTTREPTRERPESGITSLRNAENILVAGHLNLIGALLTCENVDCVKCGKLLIPLLINDYLFPASKLVLGPFANSYETFHRCSAKCTGRESRSQAYRLLTQVAITSKENFAALTSELISLHHRLDHDSIKEFERSPVVEGRCSSGYVGLKNGGATCYMNSVLQQLFLVPGIREDILEVNTDDDNDDSLFIQLQTLFGHLQESQLQYFTPEKFWKCFRMGDQPVNIREQQDAFEFYSRLTEQVDDYLKSKKSPKVFSRRFEGLYSIQRLCQDCPHRYEREEPFLALNLTVTKCNDLHDSLDQFVKGELLEGDNAYYCEKCNKKRTAVIRTCIKTLPPVLVIQLKRFGYDWEASRALKFDDYFKFPWILDMGEYTVEALSPEEPFLTPEKDNRETGDCLSMDPPKIPKTPQSPSSFTQNKSSKNTPLKLSIPSSSKFSTPRKHPKKRYELVGVIVHSGQANAGHYYSYIKDRRGDSITNPNKGRWFKFNDTSVEHVEMSNSLLEQECFGGTYKAKVSYDSSNPMPEDRLRYWNGYMLFYDSIDDFSYTPKTPNRLASRTRRNSRSSMPSSNSARKNLSLGGDVEVGVQRTSEDDCDSGLSLVPPSSSLPLFGAISSPAVAKAAQSSLCELSELLEEGEKKGMFRQYMPPRILATITHHNLTFLRDRGLYSEDYFDFVYTTCNSSLENWRTLSPCSRAMLVDSVSLGIKFLLNTYLRTRGKDLSVITKWLSLLTDLLLSESEASEWAIRYFTSTEGELHLLPLLLECPDKMVRTQFGNLLHEAICAECKHTGGTKGVQELVKNLLDFLPSQVSTFVKTSEQYFILLHKYCSQGPEESRQVLELGGFTSLIQFLLGPAEPSQRRWSPIQSQDFGPLHSTIATLILSQSAVIAMSSHDSERSSSEHDGRSQRLPPSIARVVFGPQKKQWLKEAVLAYREVVGGIPKLTEALKMLSRDDSSFSHSLITAVMIQYGSAPSNLLKDLSLLLLELLYIEDSLHNERVAAILGGFPSSQGSEVQGLLNLIDENKDSDSRRAYQCIKLIVYLSTRSPTAREHLTNTQTNWQWAVQWLRTKMDAHPSMGGNSSVSGDDLASCSNEDSNTKNFQRTTSAQWTLDEATALLSGMEAMEMEIDCDQELEQIKESPEHEHSPSVDF